MRPLLTFTAATATLLSSIGLYSLFSGSDWFWPTMGAVLSVAAASLVVQRFRLPATVGLLAGVMAILLFLTAAFTSAEALFGVIPTPDSIVRLADLVEEGRRAAGKYAAPVPLGPGIEVLAALGVGLVAIAVDLLAVRMRRAAAAGLPLLAMYSVPAAVREESITWPAFALGALGFMAMLLVDGTEQVTTWGRPVYNRRWSEDTPSERPDVGTMAVAGRRIGLAAVVIAVIVPTVVPGIHPRGFFGLGAAGSGGSGSQTVTTPDPLVSLKRELTRRDDAVVLTYRTDDGERPDYLRLYALDKFDGDRWTYSALRSSVKERVSDRPLPSPPGLGFSTARAVTTTVTVDDAVQKMTFLPMPYAPSRVSVKGDWRVHEPSLMVYSLSDTAAGKTYTVNSLRVQPPPAQLAQMSRMQAQREITARYLAVPRQVPDKVRQRAEAITTGASSPYDRAMRLQQWFTEPGRFTYDLSAQSPRRGSDLLDFLEVNRRGYCEQFAAAMAVMARTLGIPARVAMGYTAGVQGLDGRWTVRSRDAHAWPELYFEGVGWLRFEPTPGGSAGQGTASTPPYADPTPETNTPGSSEATTPGAQDSPTERPEATPSAAARDRSDRGAGATDSQSPSGSGDSGAVAGWAALVVLVLMLAVTPKIVRILMRRRRWALVRAAVATGPDPLRPPKRTAAGDPLISAEATEDPARLAAHTAWMELRATAIDHGLPWRSSESPRAAGRRLVEHLELSGPAAQALTRIVQAEERARYAPAAAPGAPATALRADARTVRDAFARSVDRGSLWRARLVPPSAVAELRQAAAQGRRAIDRVTGEGLRTLVSAARARLARRSALVRGARKRG